MDKKSEKENNFLPVNRFASNKNQYVDEKANIEPLSFISSDDIRADSEEANQETDYQFLYWQ
ncbi:hypothetical protein AM501_12210 [Aneurinibacillus migulanus]|uniref:Uncharacterized protein n=1 Tax=Aneurinibacillus migulanus TaxID=47500 RepID=A0A0D1XJQ5_ANEMI|nr:hypothetical protein [Aneurinibacillus migulanus]KIV51793.1 hypothetical protein TS65_24770 [Aneurinibacillus migulanus]KIV54506.1 hypothetical protein TS64_15840 [Aneurinibacillus migulanus]KON97912.1 hypothetical protein AF333_23250 [Aneurinibacillus migulanus]KPD08099.1 hypothetical protein AM501_12210 [Aneurinibacillus migulanus]MCP1354070.1 hypothetical protein [Aneurinibacillus migulanus]